MICPHCHNQTPEGEACIHCGAALHDAAAAGVEPQEQVMDNDSLRCPYCGAALWEDAAFCPVCGQSLNQPEDAGDIGDAGDAGKAEGAEAAVPPVGWRCPICGTINAQNTRVCRHCGYVLGDESQQDAAGSGEAYGDGEDEDGNSYYSKDYGEDAGGGVAYYKILLSNPILR